MHASIIHSQFEHLDRCNGPIDMVLDTDTYNEIDDQFALAYALLATDAMRCLAVYAAPFHNDRSESPADGMKKSFEEIERVCAAIDKKPLDGIYSGSTRWMTDEKDSVASDARDDLIKRVHARSEKDGPLYVVAIGAPTNVSSAITADPSIIDKIVIVWLGGNAQWHHSTHEFNCFQDYYASKTLFDCAAPMVRVPCVGCADSLTTTHAEMRTLCKNDNTISNYLLKIYNEYVTEDVGNSKVIWDISAIAWLINREWFSTRVCSSPQLNENMTFTVNEQRHPSIETMRLDRDAIFRDLFQRVAKLTV